MRLENHFDRERSALVLQAHLVVDEPHEMLHPVQDGLKLQLNS